MGELDPALLFAMRMRSSKFAGRSGGVHGARAEGESDELVVADPTDRREGVDCLLRPEDEYELVLTDETGEADEIHRRGVEEGEAGGGQPGSNERGSGIVPERGRAEYGREGGTQRRSGEHRCKLDRMCDDTTLSWWLLLRRCVRSARGERVASEPWSHTWDEADQAHTWSQSSRPTRRSTQHTIEHNI